MLQARTEEQLRHIVEILGATLYDWTIMGYPIHSLEFDERPVSFDQMAEIVDYLRGERAKMYINARRAAIKSNIDKLWASDDTIFLKGADVEKAKAFILSLAEFGYDTEELLNEYKQTGKITI